MTRDQLRDVLDDLVDQGFLTRKVDRLGNPIYGLTELGKLVAATTKT